MTTTTSSELLGLAQAVADAWTALDFDTLRKIVDPEVVVVHQNRGVAGHGLENMIQTIKDMRQAFPDAKLGATTRWAESGDTIFRETTWEGTAAFDVPGFGSAGEHCKLSVCSVMTFRDGKLVEWCDYG